MSDIAYKNALKRREELVREIKKIDQFLETWREFAGTEGEQTPILPSPPVVINTGNGSNTNPVEKSLPFNEMIEAIRAVLIERGRPMTRGQILKELEEHGVPVGGKDKKKNLGTMLWRARDLITHLQGHGYWPVDVEWKAADYLPGMEK